MANSNTKIKTCEWCGKELEPITIEFNNKKMVVGYKPCTCEQAVKIEEEKERKEKIIEEGKAIQRLETKMASCGVKKRYRNCNHAETDYYVNLVTDKKGDLFIYGSIGSGKTYLACSILRRLAERRNSFQFARMSELLDELLRDSYSFKVWDKCLEVDFLVLDDLGKENLSDFCLTKLFDLINERYSDEKVTIITSNFSPEELENWLSSKTNNKFLPQAIMRRILENSLLVCMDENIN